MRIIKYKGRKFGRYRTYIKLPFINYGIKTPRFHSYTIFLCGIIMNINERRRYEYYTLRKPKKQWGRMWKYDNVTPAKLCSTYFSLFGLINVVEHCITYEDSGYCDTFYNHDITDENTAYLSNDIRKLDNIGLTYNGHYVLLDYGDFHVDKRNRMSIGLIDYK